MHLNTIHCKCGYEFTKQNIKPPLIGAAQAIGKKQKNFYGGNVDKFCEANCPDCDKEYLLWLKQIGQTWKVITISAKGWDPNAASEESKSKESGDAFIGMGRIELQEWLDGHEVKYHPQTGEKKLREACRAAALLITAKDEENAE